MERRDRKPKSALNRPMTMAGLGAFTEDVILPGVERIVKDEVEGLLAEVKTGFTDLQQKIDEGFKGVHDSIRVLSGDIIELKVQEKDQRHEARLGRVEEKLGIRRR